MDRREKYAFGNRVQQGCIHEAVDIAAVAATALTGRSRPPIYALTGPETLLIEDCLAIIGPALKRMISYRALGVGDFRSMMIGFRLYENFADVVARRRQDLLDRRCVQRSTEVPWRA